MDILTYIKSRRFTQKEFAKLVGISCAALSNYICKKRKPTLDIAVKIEEITGGKVTVNDQYKWWESKNGYKNNVR